MTFAGFRFGYDIHKKKSTVSKTEGALDGTRAAVVSSHGSVATKPTKHIVIDTLLLTHCY